MEGNPNTSVSLIRNASSNPSLSSTIHSSPFAVTVLATPALVREACTYLSSRDLGRVACTCSRLSETVNGMVNTLPVSELSALIERGIAATTLSAVPRSIKSVRKVIACELIENYKLGFQASSGRALWPHFQRLVSEAATALRSAGSNLSAGLQACTIDRLNERLGWLSVHARLCCDHVQTDWLLRQHDLTYIASRGAIFAREFMWHSKFPIACQKHVHKGPEDRKEEDEEPSDTQQQLSSITGSASNTINASSLASTIPRLTVPATVKVIQSAMASANVIAQSAATESNTHCLYCHPLAYLTQRCVFDVVHILRKSEANAARGGSESTDDLLAIIKYAAAFMPHLTSQAERRVVRLMIIHILRKARPPRYVPSSIPTTFSAPSSVVSTPVTTPANKLMLPPSALSSIHPTPPSLSRSLSFSNLAGVASSSPVPSAPSTPAPLYPSPSAPQHHQYFHYGIGEGYKVEKSNFLQTPHSRKPSGDGSAGGGTHALQAAIAREVSPPSNFITPPHTPTHQPGAPTATPPITTTTASNLMPPPPPQIAHAHQHVAQPQQSQQQQHTNPSTPYNGTKPQQQSHLIAPVPRPQQQHISSPVGRSASAGATAQQQAHQQHQQHQPHQYQHPPQAPQAPPPAYERHSSTVDGSNAQVIASSLPKHIRIETNIDSPARLYPLNISTHQSQPPQPQQSQPQHPPHPPAASGAAASTATGIAGSGASGQQQGGAISLATNPPSLPRGQSTPHLQSLQGLRPSARQQQTGGGSKESTPSSSAASSASSTPTHAATMAAVNTHQLSNTTQKNSITSNSNTSSTTTQSSNTGGGSSGPSNTASLSISVSASGLQLLRAVISTDLLSDELILNEVLAQQHDHQLDRKRARPSSARFRYVHQPSVLSTSTSGGSGAAGPTDALTLQPNTSSTTTSGGDDEIDQYLSFGSSYVIEST